MLSSVFIHNIGHKQGSVLYEFGSGQDQFHYLLLLLSLSLSPFFFSSIFFYLFCCFTFFQGKIGSFKDMETDDAPSVLMFVSNTKQVNC